MSYALLELPDFCACRVSRTTLRASLLALLHCGALNPPGAALVTWFCVFTLDTTQCASVARISNPRLHWHVGLLAQLPSRHMGKGRKDDAQDSTSVLINQFLQVTPQNPQISSPSAPLELHLGLDPGSNFEPCPNRRSPQATGLQKITQQGTLRRREKSRKRAGQ